MSVKTLPYVPYKVKDMSLAEWGRKEIELAEDDNLTGLQTITKKAFHMLISNRTTKHHADAHN